jgi:hypothetical protein
MAMIRSYIIGTADQGDGMIAVTGTDGHGNYATVHCGHDKIIDGTVYVMLDAGIAKQARVKAALGRADEGNRDEG